eukprot:294943_1
MSLENVKIEVDSKTDNDEIQHLLRCFVDINNEKEKICIINENQLECDVIDRLSFMLTLLQNKMHLLGCVLKLYNANHVYDVNQLYQDINHVETKHFKDITRLKEYILNKKFNPQLKRCSVHLACWSLRRYTRSDKDHFSTSAVSNVQAVEANVIKIQQETNIPVVVIAKQLDILHCNIFHLDHGIKQRVDFRRLYVDYNNYSNQTIQDLLNYLH